MIQTLPIYNNYFPNNHHRNWDDFKSPPESAYKIPAKSDFIVQTPKKNSTLKKITLLFLKIIILPWGLYNLTKNFLKALAMTVIYPATLTPSDKYNLFREVILKSKNKNLVFRDIFLERNGKKYSGLIAAQKKNIDNQKWILFSPGNMLGIEHCFQGDPSIAESLLSTNYNLLLVNGPGVGRSSNPATPKILGRAQELGIQFLETALKAKKIILMGQSLGGGAIGEAVLQHKFKPDIDYLAIRFMTFDSLPSIAEKTIGCIGRRVLNWLGYKLDNVLASKKLSDLNIPEVVIQAEKEEVLSGATLLGALQKQNITKNKYFAVIPNTDHNYMPYPTIHAAIRSWDPKKTLWQRVFGR